MRILVACEESQRVCIAFRKKGHEAYSCDLLDCSGGSPQWHIKDNVLNVISMHWDMIIAFPPCTDLASSGARWFPEKQKNGSQQLAIDFFMKFANLNCPKIAIENPVGIMSSKFRKPDQIINPWQFGEPVNKRTCLWLKGLPKLLPTTIVKPDYEIRPNGYRMDKWTYELRKTWNREYMAKEMSKTFQGIANAMADQWS